MTHSEFDCSAVTVCGGVTQWLFVLPHQLTNPSWLRRVTNHLWINGPHWNTCKAASWQVDICDYWEATCVSLLGAPADYRTKLHFYCTATFLSQIIWTISRFVENPKRKKTFIKKKTCILNPHSNRFKKITRSYLTIWFLPLGNPIQSAFCIHRFCLGRFNWMQMENIQKKAMSLLAWLCV